MTQPITDRLKANRPRICEVKRCARPAHRFGGRCLTHDTNMRDRGHETANQITARDLKPWTHEAQGFVDAQASRNQPGVTAALRWLHSEMASAIDPGLLNRWATRDQRYQAWLAKASRDQVEPARLLATAIAVHLHRRYCPDRYPTDRFFAHQLGRHVVRCNGRQRARSGNASTVTSRAPSGLILKVAERYSTVLGALLIRASEHVADAIERAAQPPIAHEDLHAPFEQRP